MSILTNTFEFCQNWFCLCIIIVFTYLVSAGSIYWLLYRQPNPKAMRLRLKKQQARKPIIVNDIKLSVLSAIFFALSIACFIYLYDKGVTKVYIYANFPDLGYIILSYGVVLILQDTYFYFMHRLLHLPIFFKRLHGGHHRSHPPTPWTYFALEPFEAIAQAFFLLCLTLILPLHMGVLVFILMTMVVWSIGNHLGFQVVTASYLSRIFGTWCIGSVYHCTHHYQYHKHYGLYFTFWDKAMNTYVHGYEANIKESLGTYM